MFYQNINSNKFNKKFNITALKAFKMTSVILWEVSTFPPTIAASSDGFNRLYSGMIAFIGFKQP